MQISPCSSAMARLRLVPALLAISVFVGCSAPALVEIPLTTAAIVIVSPPPVEPGAADHEQKFLRWVAEFRDSAGVAGIDEETLKTAFDSVRFLPRVIESDQAQPEFTRNVWDYLDSAVSRQRVSRGQEKLFQLQPILGPIAVRYGVPTEILVAIWGMESSYGSFTGDISTIDALATLGFEGRREQWARGQLLAALKILQNHDVDRTQMLGSWAGAMGQTQFLPSNFLAYAVDADGDGKRDIWGNVADVMASTANFVAHSGWQADQTWGTEVRLPPGFDYARADADVRHPTSVWVEEGVKTMGGTPLPVLPDSSILLPAGARGPAFLIGPNFRALLRYNNSTSYALAVGLLAQRLAGGGATLAPWPRDLQALTRTQLQALQTALNVLGFDTGTPDGRVGPATRHGVRLYQLSRGLPADGYPTGDLLQQGTAVAQPGPQGQ